MKLGDKVEKVIETVLPAKVLEHIKKNGCGCEKRKKWLNDLTEE